MLQWIKNYLNKGFQKSQSGTESDIKATHQTAKPMPQQTKHQSQPISKLTDSNPKPAPTKRKKPTASGRSTRPNTKAANQSK